MPAKEQACHLIVMRVDAVRHLELALGDADALAGRHGIDRHQLGGRTAVAGDDDLALMC